MLPLWHADTGLRNLQPCHASAIAAQASAKSSSLRNRCGVPCLLGLLCGVACYRRHLGVLAFQLPCNHPINFRFPLYGRRGSCCQSTASRLQFPGNISLSHGYPRGVSKKAIFQNFPFSVCTLHNAKVFTPCPCHSGSGHGPNRVVPTCVADVEPCGFFYVIFIPNCMCMGHVYTLHVYTPYFLCILLLLCFGRLLCV